MLYNRRNFIRLSSTGLILPLMGHLKSFGHTPGDGKITLTREALRIHRDALVIDGHNDLADKILKKGFGSLEDFSLKDPQPELQTDIPRLRKGGVDAQVWVAYVSPDYMITGGGHEACLEQINLIRKLVGMHGDDLELATTSSGIEGICREGKIASLIGVEGGHAIENSLENLATYYQLGVRYMTLTHNGTTDWADASYDRPRHGGLSEFGEEVVREMNRLGMLVDVSHTSDDTVRDVLRVCSAPVIASHSSAYALCPSRRNLKDELIGGIAATGGMVMVNFYPVFIHPDGAAVESRYIEKTMELKELGLSVEEFNREMDAWEKEQSSMPSCTPAHVVDHIEHIIGVAGIDHVGLGSDYDGITYGPDQMPDVSGFPYITQVLYDRGYGEPEIKKILGGNFLRVLSAAEERKKELLK